MAEVNPGFQANEGSPDQLPRGAAEAANAGTDVEAPAPIETPAPAPEAAPEAPGPVATPADFEPQYTPETDDDKFLVGPSERPDEASWVGANPPRGQSPAVRRNLNLLQEAASVPGASAELQALVSYLIRTA